MTRRRRRVDAGEAIGGAQRCVGGCRRQEAPVPPDLDGGTEGHLKSCPVNGIGIPPGENGVGGCRLTLAHPSQEIGRRRAGRIRTLCPATDRTRTALRPGARAESQLVNRSRVLPPWMDLRGESHVRGSRLAALIYFRLETDPASEGRTS